MDPIATQPTPSGPPVTASAQETVPQIDGHVQAVPASLEANKAAAAQWVTVRTARDLGDAILRRRQELGYGLVEAAALCQVGTRFLFELEHGKATVEFDRALRVASRFGIRVRLTLDGGQA